MPLPYFARAVCLMLCSAALLQFAFELFARAVIPVLLQIHAQARARRLERWLFVLALTTRLAPWGLALGLILPAYLRAEDNHNAEQVTLVSLGFAACVLLWSAMGVLRAARAVAAGRRCVRRSWPTARDARQSPVMLYPDHPSLLAVAGVFRCSILVSPAMLDGERFSAAALEVAFAHEWAHVQQRDNLKILLLAVLPHVTLSSCARASLSRQWRLAAEMAADEEGTSRRPDRSLLLASMLVALARDAGPGLPQGVTALHADSEHLRLRVERLLEPRPGEGRDDPLSVRAFFRGPRSAVLLVTTGLVLMTSLLILCPLLSHSAAELLFHGAFQFHGAFKHAS